MQNRVQKWGNSLAVRIPKALADDINIDKGSVVEFTRENGSIIITPKVVPEYNLEQLLDGITDENLHSEVQTGIEVGNEVIGER
jgi:antitoxin MazE